MSKKKDPIVLGAGALIIAVVFFLIGMQVQKSATPAPIGNSANSPSSMARGAYGGGPGYRRGGGTFGQVTSVTPTSIVIQSRSGSNVTVALSSTTTVLDSMGATSSISAIKTGDTVMVSGTTNSDGSVSAARVLINPSFGGTGANTPPPPASTN
jgi:Domain of unknown function (DUF5666)